MKFISQFIIIIAFTFIGELLHFFIPLPIPASIYGIVLLFICLMMKWIKVAEIRETSTFLIAIMPVMFIPAAVGLITMLKDSIYFGALLSLGAYAIGVYLRRRTGWSFLNPLLTAIVLVIVCLLCTGMRYKDYLEDADWVSYLLTPATICLAVPLYQQVELLKKNFKAIMIGISSGVLSSLITVLLLALLMRFDHTTYVTFLPKSITTAIGMGVAEELGGYVSVTVVVIILSGVLGNIFAEKFLKLLRIEEPIAKGIALGSASHAIGTAKAMEMGSVEGATSSLSIVVSGILTVVGASLFAMML